MTLSNKWYDRLKNLVLVVLPALITGAYALGLDGGVYIAGGTFLLGITVKVSARAYYKSERAEVINNFGVDGVIHVSEDPGGKMFTIEPKEDDLDKLGEKPMMVFRVEKSSL